MRRWTRKREVRWLLVACLPLACGGESGRTGAHASAGPAELRLVDEIGQPIPRTALLVDGALVTTDALGRATTASLPAKYDVAVVVGGTAYVFLGLTTRSPLLELLDTASPELTSYATVDLENPSELGDDERVLFMAGVTDLAADQQVVSFDTGQAGPYARVTWPGVAERTLSTAAVVAELDAAQSTVIGYSAYAAQSFQLVPDDQVTWAPVLGEVPFETATIHVASDAVPEARSVTYSSWVRQAAGPAGESAFAAGVPNADLTVLDLPDARYTVTAQGYYDTGTFVAVQDDVEVGASVHLQAALPPVALVPDDEASIDIDTEFRWTAVDGAVYRFLAYTDDGEQPFLQYEVVTAEPATTLPDLSPLGLAFPRGRNLVWSVHAEHGQTSVDADAAGLPLSGLGIANSRLATMSP